VGIFETVTLPITLSGVTTQNRICSNLDNFFISSSLSSFMYSSSDGKSWVKNDVLTSILRITPLSNGVLVTDNSFAIYFSKNNKSAKRIFNSITALASLGTSALLPTSSTASKFISQTPPFKKVSVDSSAATGTILVPDFSFALTITTAAQATLTVSLPLFAYSGYRFDVRFVNAMTTLTFNTQTSGQTVRGGATWVTTATAQQSFSFIFDGADWMVL
jgi:hypothetical protein